MTFSRRKIRVGILGCGAIGSGIAKNIRSELKKNCCLTALFDIEPRKSAELAKKLKLKNISKRSEADLLKSCDLVVEAVNAPNTAKFIKNALTARKHVLAMSVGKLLKEQKFFRLAEKMNRSLLIPSGAIAGLDAIKAAGLAGFSSVTLTTRKPLSGFQGVKYLKEKGIILDHIRSETTLFEGDVDSAVRFFPQNINVAAALSLACNISKKIKIKIITSPHFKINSHEIDARGPFGRILTRTENVISPDNPKTSYLAILSGIQTLKQFFNQVKIGT